MTHTTRRTLAGISAAGLLATVLGVAASSPATAAPRAAALGTCKISTLPYPTDTYRAGASVIDPSGRFIAGDGLRETEDGNQYLLLFWDGDRLTEVEAPSMATPADVNADGVVIGNGWGEGVNGQPWRYRNGKVEQLPVVPSTTGISVTAINKAGDIVGFGTDVVTDEYFVLRWPAARPGTVEVLDAPANARPEGITANGTIVGSAGDFGYWTSWVRRPNGRYDALTVPGAQMSYVSAAAGHWAIGHVDLPDSIWVPVRWNLRDGSYTTLDPQSPLLEDVNAKGVVVGADRVVRGATSRVLPGGSDEVGIGARSISDTGTIVGFRNGERLTPVRWTGC
ncbi:hypothetical protein AB0B86_13325 [Micromonospora sp. NPDC049047]|uniref:hypothetical protein n=1 Tax=Micromonospora sp. NPDC049047 TaxID=3155645 RepID=UPI0033C1AF65